MNKCFALLGAILIASGSGFNAEAAMFDDKSSGESAYLASPDPRIPRDFPNRKPRPIQPKPEPEVEPTERWIRCEQTCFDAYWSLRQTLMQCKEGLSCDDWDPLFDNIRWRLFDQYLACIDRCGSQNE
jgi:hypothetical protein